MRRHAPSLRPSRSLFFIGALATCALTALVAACTSDLPDPLTSPSSSDSGVDSGADAAASDARSTDDAGDAGDAGCDGSCVPTLLHAVVNGVDRTLDRAQFGTDAVDAGPALHVEAHAGGDPACPNESSPSPDRTLVVSGIPRGKVGSVLTEADGVKVSFLDFTNEQLPDVPLIEATTVHVTVKGEDVATPPSWVSIDVDATFAEGTVSGHVEAAYCASLSAE